MTEPEDLDELTSRLRALARDDERLGASRAVETRLQGEVRALGRARRRTALLTALGVAAVLLLTVTISVWRGIRPGPGAREPASAPAREIATAFFPLPYSHVPAATTYRVRLEVPRSALASFGLASIEAADIASGATVTADLVVGDDGLARAVRFVRPVAQ